MTTVHASPPEPGTKPRYPFDEWLDGREWTLTRGRDFWGDAATFRHRIQGAANARRVGLHVMIAADQRHLTVRAVPNG